MNLSSFALGEFKNCRVLVLGDVMLDRYLWGSVKRISPEAPVPVFLLKEKSEVTGGAGNVVANLVGLGCQVSIIGVCGNDEAGKYLSEIFRQQHVANWIIVDHNRPTITKTRLLSAGQQLMRIDEEQAMPLTDCQVEQVFSRLERLLADHDVVILSDYGKGIFQTIGVTEKAIGMACVHGIPVLVDPKGSQWERYRNATCITPNTAELEDVAARDLEDENILEVEAASILRRYNLSNLLVTRGAKGMCLMGIEGAAHHIAATAKEVYDVSGAGDTVISTIAAGLAAGLPMGQAAELANIAAGIVVSKLGTQPIHLCELEAAVRFMESGDTYSSVSKIASLSAAKALVNSWKTNGEVVVFTNGCFDLLHPGHIHILHQAKALGGRLVIGLNSDASIRRLKGAERPILKEQDRAAMLAALDCVDLVVIFEDDTPLSLISSLKPNTLVKGADYSIDQVVGREEVAAYGGNVELVALLEGYSTTKISKRIKKEA